ncbi:MAG: EF-P beta-lysylation protein EpmB [Sedimenticola sp.]|nr:MAG: EF-P beta-lysylation protein EpmB [Sedimenticola sp.]
MIHRTEPVCQTPQWQQSLAKAITSLEGLCQHLQIAPSELPFSWEAGQQFPMRVPVNYADLIEKNNPSDPLLLQILPSFQELNHDPAFQIDPVGDLSHHPVPGVIHKYNGRALIITTGACAIHCRYCFRRHFPYAESVAKRQQWLESLTYLQGHQEVNEVILSGGDPLSLSDQALQKLLSDLAEIGHLKRLRIHTRMPSVLPERITPEFLALLTGSRLSPVMVVHINHPRELSESARQALKAIKQTGTLLLNQSVLLRGVNDRSDTLVELSEALFQSDVLPYYLHLLDRVQGAAHFDVSRARALDLHTQVLANLPGFLVPRLVMEQKGAASKLAVIR